MKIEDIKGKVDFAIISIRDDEYQAVVSRMENLKTVEGKRYYRVTRIEASGGRSYLVAVICANEQGTGEAQNLARDIIDDLDPQWILIVGIGGGVPDTDLTLGDVALSFPAKKTACLQAADEFAIVPMRYKSCMNAGVFVE